MGLVIVCKLWHNLKGWSWLPKLQIAPLAVWKLPPFGKSSSLYDHRSYLANDVDDCISQIAWDFFVLDQYVPPKESSFFLPNSRFNKMLRLKSLYSNSFCWISPGKVTHDSISTLYYKGFFLVQTAVHDILLGTYCEDFFCLILSKGGLLR